MIEDVDIVVVINVKEQKGRRKKTEEVFAATIFVGGAEMANGASFPTVGLFAATEIVAGMGAGAGTPIRSFPERAGLVAPNQGSTTYAIGRGGRSEGC